MEVLSSRDLQRKQFKKYELYESSVQDAESDAKNIDDLYKKIRKRKAQSLREDFCGTFNISSEWVKLDPNKTAVGLDIDPEPLSYGLTVHYPKLTKDQQRRVKPLQKNVMESTKPGVDVVAAGNFSFWIFKTRNELIKYFKAVKRSLKPDGLFILDMVGGTEMVEEHEDEEDFGRGKNRFTYFWKLERYNPITNEGFFSISYKTRSGINMKRAFTYDWRVWSIPEVCECLREAGLPYTAVYWEEDDEDGDGTGEFRRTEKEENCEVWIASIVASKKPI